MMKANKKVMAALLAAMMTVSAGAAVVSADQAVSKPGDPITSDSTTATGWHGKNIKVNGKTVTGYYYKTGTKTYASGWQLIDGNWYYFAQLYNGDLYANGYKVGDNNWNVDYTVANSTSAGEPHYVIMNTKTNIVCADNKEHAFRFDANGKMVTGWYKTSNAVDPIWGDAQNWEYYSPSTGAQQKGWIKVGANWFYMTDVETVVEYKENGQWLRKTLPANTLMMNGTYKFLHGSEAGKTYTFAANGVLVNEGQGWVKEDGNWYWVQENGSRFTGVAEFSDGTGYIYSSASWNKINGKYYLFEDSGKMLTGWQRAFTDANKTDNKWYYMTANGDCVLNNWVQMSNGDWYLTNASGEMVTGWAVRGGKTYFLNDGRLNDVLQNKLGVMATGTVMIDGDKCTFDANGALIMVNNQTVNPGVIPQ